MTVQQSPAGGCDQQLRVIHNSYSDATTGTLDYIRNNEPVNLCKHLDHNDDRDDPDDDDDDSWPFNSIIA